jgi:hypothetical protein
MNELLTKILEAHGSMNRWSGYEKVEATIVRGGGFSALKDVHDFVRRHAQRFTRVSKSANQPTA